MKKLLIILLLFPFIGFSQEISKRELSNIIKEIVRINKKNIYSELVLVANNTDSTFFNSQKVKFFTSRFLQVKNNPCRTLRLNFFDKNFVSFEDCQTCKEPSSCYVTKEKSIFKYELLEDKKEVYLNFSNRFEERKYKISMTRRNSEGKITMIEMIRI